MPLVFNLVCAFQTSLLILQVYESLTLPLPYVLNYISYSLLIIMVN